MTDIRLFIGGARSGKSRLAQEAAEALPGRLVYIATAQALDAEMADRIAHHRADRGPRWNTIESPVDLPGLLPRESRKGTTVLVDCLTLWLSNLMCGDYDVAAATAALQAGLAKCEGSVILVSNEVGLGIVPENALARRFRDDAGRLNQSIAAMADTVIFTAAGLGLRLK